MRSFILSLAAVALLWTSGCNSSKETQQTPPAKATATAQSTAATAAKEPDAELDDEDIPVAEDYEDKADTEITKENLEEELAKLEKELAEDKDDEPAEKKN